MSKIYKAALENDRKKVTKLVQQKQIKWSDEIFDGNEKISSNVTLTKITPIYAAVINLTDYSGEIAYLIAYSMSNSWTINFFVLSVFLDNIIAVIYKLLLSGDKYTHWVQLLIPLKSFVSFSNNILLSGYTPYHNVIARDIITLHAKHPYLTAIMTNNIIKYNTKINKILSYFKYTPSSVPIKVLDHIIKIMILFGNEPSPYTLYKIFREKKWNKKINTIVEALINYGYNFNAKYISYDINEPIFFSLLETKVDQKYIINLILTGRIDIDINNLDYMIKTYGDKNLVEAVKIRRYMLKTNVIQLCDKNIDNAQHILKNIAYQLQLNNTNNTTDICKCIKNMISAEEKNIFPYKKIFNNRNGQCVNNEVLGMTKVKKLSHSQLIVYKDPAGPHFCFDKQDIKQLLKSGFNPYTKMHFPIAFMNELIQNYDIQPPPLELDHAVKELTKNGNLHVYKSTDFDNVFSRFIKVMGNATITTALADYQKWATQYTIDDYSRINKGISGKKGFVQHLSLNPIDANTVQEYVTILMSVLLNLMEDNKLTPTFINTHIKAMCTYIPVPTVPTVPKQIDTEFDDMTIEELNILKGSLMKEFLSGGMKDKNLMHKINNIRNHITAQEN